MFTLLHRKTPMRSPAFSPDGRKLAAAQARGGVVVWDLASRTLERDLEAGSYTGGIAFPAADQVFAVRWDGLLHFAGADTDWQMIPKPPGHEHHVVRAAAVAPGLSRLFLGLTSSVHALPLPQPAPPLWGWPVEGHHSLWSLALTPDGKALAAGTDYGRVHLLDARTGKEQATWRADGSRAGVTALSLSPDGKAVAWCAGSRLRLARLGGPGIIERSLGKTHFLGVAWHPSGGFFATVNGDGKADFWDAVTAERRESFDWRLGKLNGIAFDATGCRAAASSERGEIVVWDIDV